MANANLFGGGKRVARPADAVNNAGGNAYKLSDQLALAQFAATGTFNDTYYVTAETQLEQMLKVAKDLPNDFIAKAAVYARKHSKMKDTPALLLGVLFSRCEDAESRALFARAFDHVVDNGKILRNFVQMVRSGALGRKSFGSHGKRCINNWIHNRGTIGMFWDSVGNNPSIADIIRMTHPKPRNDEEAATYRYLIGKELTDEQFEALPQLIKDFESFKEDPENYPVPQVPFQMIAGLDISDKVWKEIFRNGGWHFTRMNINTALRHNVFDDREMVDLIANRLNNPEILEKVNAFPYQLFTTWKSLNPGVPRAVLNALQDAVEYFAARVPPIEGSVVVAVDTSGSMGAPATGWRKGATTDTRCVDVAALIAASVYRSSEDVRVIPFDTRTHKADNLNYRDTVTTIAETLAGYGGGGTDCAAPLRLLNEERASPDVVIMVSDNESWFLNRDRYWYGYGTAPGKAPTAMAEWHRLGGRKHGTKLICIDLTPGVTNQFDKNKDILRIGGFSDTIWDVIQDFLNGNHGPDLWLQRINEVVV